MGTGEHCVKQVKINLVWVFSPMEAYYLEPTKVMVKLSYISGIIMIFF